MGARSIHKSNLYKQQQYQNSPLAESENQYICGAECIFKKSEEIVAGIQKDCFDDTCLDDKIKDMNGETSPSQGKET